MVAGTIFRRRIAQSTAAITIHGTLVTVTSLVHASFAIRFFNGDFILPSAFFEYLKQNASKRKILFLIFWILIHKMNNILIDLPLKWLAFGTSCFARTDHVRHYILAMIQIWTCTAGYLIIECHVIVSILTCSMYFWSAQLRLTDSILVPSCNWYRNTFFMHIVEYGQSTVYSSVSPNLAHNCCVRFSTRYDGATVHR